MTSLKDITEEALIKLLPLDVIESLSKKCLERERGEKYTLVYNISGNYKPQFWEQNRVDDFGRFCFEIKECFEKVRNINDWAYQLLVQT
jgi:hypothetical protein